MTDEQINAALLPIRNTTPISRLNVCECRVVYRVLNVGECRVVYRAMEAAGLTNPNPPSVVVPAAPEHDA